jgi:hypothetical protein
MNVSEFSLEFDVLYNNITSNLSPGLSEYEKSVFLTRAQEQIVKNHFGIKSNSKQEGLNNSIKRDTDFSTLFKTVSINSGITEIPNPTNTLNTRVRRFTIKEDYLFIINEFCEIVKRDSAGNVLDTQLTTVVPLHYSEFARLNSGPYKEPNLHETWRIISDVVTVNESTFDLYIRYNWTLTNYIIRYIKKPNPIILEELNTQNLTIDGKHEVSSCELNPILHQEVLDRAVELAKVAFLGSTEEVINVNQRNE